MALYTPHISVNSSIDSKMPEELKNIEVCKAINWFNKQCKTTEDSSPTFRNGYFKLTF